MLDSEKAAVDALSREEMARLWRYAPVGDPMFQGDRGAYFLKRFFRLGGFDPALSKRIGWDDGQAGVDG